MTDVLSRHSSWTLCVHRKYGSLSGTYKGPVLGVLHCCRGSNRDVRSTWRHWRVKDAW